MSLPIDRRAGRTVRRCAATLAAMGLLCAGSSAGSVASEAAEATETAGQAAAEESAGCDVRWIAWGTAREPGNSLPAGLESLAGAAREARTEVRGECALDRGAVHLGARPRFALDHRWWNDRPAGDGTGSEVSFYLNEGELAWEPDPTVRLSLERSVADWGPASTISPSNPLGSRNARQHPKEELAGSDFAALRWFAADAWTAALLLNLAEGRSNPTRFHRTALLKIDRAQGDTFLSLVLSQAEGGQARVGGYAIGSLGGALRVYAEAGGARRDVEAVAGVSYAFGAGGMLAAEYFHNESGSADREAAILALGLAAEQSRDLFLRKNYAMLQWSNTDARAGYEALLRVVQGLDDGSSALVGHAEQGIGEHVRVFVFAVRTIGGRGDEFPAVLRSTLSAGLEYAF